MLFVFGLAISISANAQNTQADLSKARQNASKERVELKEKTEDLRITRLKAQHLQTTLTHDKEELKKQKAAVESLESKINKREKDLTVLNERIKESESAISKLKSEASRNKKMYDSKTLKKSAD
jgi:chromosome segregation ATPase